MAGPFAREVGSVGVRALPLTDKFRSQLVRQLRAIRPKPEFNVEAVVDKVRLKRGEVRRSLQQQLDSLKDLRLDVDVNANVRKIRNAIESISERAREIDLVASFDKNAFLRVNREIQDMIRDIEVHVDLSEEVGQQIRRMVNEIEHELRDLNEMSLFDDLGDADFEWIHHQMGKLRRELERVKHEASRVDEELDDMAEDRTVRLDVNPSTLWASQRLRWLTRPRMVEIIPRVSNAALAKAATALAALSGARLSGDYLRRFSDWISEVDKKLPALTFSTLGLTTAFSGLMGSVAGLVGLGDGLVATLPSLLLLPGLLANAAISVATLWVAMQDAGEHLNSIKNDWADLGHIIRDNFWEEAKQPIIEFSNSVMPQLERSFEKTAKAMGRFTGQLADDFKREFANGRLEAMFDGLVASWDELSKGTAAFAGAITNLGLVAARYMPRLAAWFVRQADTFDNWLSAVATDGRLDQWMEEAIDSFYALWDVMAATTGIFAGIWRAAEAAGYEGLRGFANMLMRWDEAVSGMRWQRTLTAMFRGAREAMDGLGDGFHDFGLMLDYQRETIEYFMGTAGHTLGTFISDIAEALSRPEFSQGMWDLVDGFADGLAGLAPALAPMSDALGNLLSFIGDLASELGPVLETVFTPAAEILSEFFDSLEKNDVLSRLADAFKRLVDVAAPILSDLAGVLGDELVPALVDLLEAGLPAIESLLDLLGPVAVQSLEGAAVGIGSVADAIGLLNDAAEASESGDWSKLTEKPPSEWAEFADNMLRLQPINRILMDLGINWENLTGILEGAREKWDGIVTAFTEWEAPDMGEFFAGLVGGLEDNSDVIAEWFITLPERISAWIGEQYELLTAKGAEILEGLRIGLEESLPLIGEWFGALPSHILGLLIDSATWLIVSGLEMIGGLRDGVILGFELVRQWFVELPARVTQFFASAVSWLIPSGQNMMSGLRSGIASGWQTVAAWFRGIPGMVRGFFAGVGSWLVSSGQALLEGFASGIQSAIASVKSKVSSALEEIRGAFPFSPAKWGPFSGRGWVSYSGESIGQTFGDSIQKSLLNARSSVAAGLSGLKREFDQFNQGVDGPDIGASVRADMSAARGQVRRSLQSLTSNVVSAAQPAVAGPQVNVNATFAQRQERDQFRDFMDTFERSLREV